MKFAADTSSGWSDHVVMPEHVHLLLSEPAKKDPSKILQVLKQKVARALLKKRRRATNGTVVVSL